MNFKDFYKVLGVKPGATQSEIKTAYRKLSKKFHPDVNDGDQFFEERFKEIQEAYEMLSNISRRKQYDDQFKSGDTSEKPSGYSKSKEEPFRQPDQNKESRPNSFATKKTPKTFSFYRFLTLFVVCIVLALFRAAMNKSIVANAENSYKSQLSAIPNPVYADPETKGVKSKDSGMPIKPEIDSHGSGIILKYKNKFISIDSFPSDLNIEDSGPLKKIFRDLDKDGAPEIITEYWSGGAHCCNINNVFTLDADGTYKNIFEYSGDITVDRNKLVLDFSETMGYFLSCYNCNIEDSLPKSNFKPEINLIYSNKRFFLAPNNPYVDYGLTEDLVQLYYRNIPRLDDMHFDDGTRKAFASRIIVYYFNNGADLQKSKDLFYKYYPGNDNDFVWNKINDYLKGLNIDLSPYVSL